MTYQKRVAFYETDMMGVVHHANYLRYFEDSRLEWLAQSGLLEDYQSSSSHFFAVTDANAKYIKPARYGDLINIHMQVRKIKAKLEFRYAIYSSQQELLCTGSSTHVTVNAEMKVCKIPKPILEKLENEKWIETWPSNL